ncbi:AarF/UbiB family protein [Parabacteroides sp. PF5-6]|uniref:protein kinase domain-containing protein n=1 Tax=Parabacteroides sp. PF5-6 TaxID=1742403 RepID=UPI002405B3BC|nr:AarF/UbiB family protein [Parabacteroides sp. PF5-6]MDF9829487.1 TPR repeat protein [Parabacteroides sp. PF5-6]
MNYPLISEYIEAIRSPEDNFDKLNNLRPVKDEDGNPIMSSGNFAVVFKMTDGEKNYAIKCFTKEQKGRAEAYQLISEALDNVKTDYLIPVKYYDNELFVDSKQTDVSEFSIILMDWIDGISLDEYLKSIINNAYKREKLADEFQKLVCWLLPQPFAHGDLKPDNILVLEDGSIVLLDYDGMFVSSMKGQKARELGSPLYRYRGRTVETFDEHIDDYAAVLILLLLRVIAVQPCEFEELLSDDTSSFLHQFDSLLNDKRISPLLSAYLLVSSFGRMDTQLVYSLLSDNSHYDFEKESNLLTRAKKADTNAMIQLADLYYKGYYAPKNYSRALKWYELALRLGNINANHGLCQCYCYDEEFFTNEKNDFIDILANREVDFCYCKGQLLEDSNPQEAIKWYKKAAGQGYSTAQIQLGLCYANGIGVDKDEQKAVVWYTKAAEQGNSNAQMLLGFCYINGRGVKNSNNNWLEWFTKAAEQENSLAQYMLGFNKLNCFSITVSTDEEKEKAVEWYTKSAEQGYSNAQYDLGVCYENGTGVEIDEHKAVEWFTKAAEQGLLKAQLKLGNYYKNGHAIENDEQKAVKWWRKAAEQGDSVAQCNLGHCYKNGTGIKIDTQKAIEWYTKAAEQGNTIAQYHLGDCYRYYLGPKNDRHKAVQWYKKAAEQGYSEAQYYLGECYMFGEGVEKDEHKAFQWYAKAAEQGCLNAQITLGDYYMSGFGIEKDEHKAFQWYTKAAEQGDLDTQITLGDCYRSGSGVKKDEHKAFQWYAKVAKQGNSQALNKLGNCYENGIGVDKDEFMAFQCYTEAEREGYSIAEFDGQYYLDALYNLARCYRNGIGVEKDEYMAYDYDLKAEEEENSWDIP